MQSIFKANIAFIVLKSFEGKLFTQFVGRNVVAALRSLCINDYVFFWIVSVGKTGLVFVSPSKGKDWFRSWKCYCCLQIYCSSSPDCYHPFKICFHAVSGIPVRACRLWVMIPCVLEGDHLILQIQGQIKSETEAREILENEST